MATVTITAPAVTINRRYASTLNVFEALNWAYSVPSYVDGESTRETVDDSGTLGTGSIIYLDKAPVINDTETLFYGDSYTELLKTTHYTIDNDTGAITLTSTGAALIGSETVYATYKYVQVDGNRNITDSYVARLLDTASDAIDRFTYRTWQAAETKLRERTHGKGQYDRLYRTKELPVYYYEDTLSSAISDTTGTTFTVSSTTDLSVDDYLAIGQEVIQVTSVTNTTTFEADRGQLGSTASTHSSGDYVVNIIVEVSTTPLGSTPDYQFLTFLDDWSFNERTYSITLLHNEITDEGFYIGLYPQKGTPDRVRITYKYGADEVDVTIREACVSMVASYLVSRGAARSEITGAEQLSQVGKEMLTQDIQDMLRTYRIMLM